MGTVGRPSLPSTSRITVSLVKKTLMSHKVGKGGIDTSRRGRSEVRSSAFGRRVGRVLMFVYLFSPAPVGEGVGYSISDP